MAKGNLVKFTAFRTEEEAIAMLESLRWPNGAVCPHCGGADPYRLTARTVTPGKRSARPGLWKCRACRKQFTVKVGTIFESSHIPVSKWLMAIHLICASKKGMSALQFQRMLGMTYRSAWFMAHRLRHAMAEDGTFKLDGTVEVDETYIGARKIRGSKRGRPGPDSPKVPVVALVQRGGAARAFPVERVTAATLKDAIRQNVKADATLMTDELPAYKNVGQENHETVNHSDGQYVRGSAHVNTAEGFFALLKRGVMGTFHHISRGHMHRYCDEFAFRYTNRIAQGVNDEDRAKLLVLAAEGKRLTFKQPSGASAA